MGSLLRNLHTLQTRKMNRNVAIGATAAVGTVIALLNFNGSFDSTKSKMNPAEKDNKKEEKDPLAGKAKTINPVVDPPKSAGNHRYQFSKLAGGSGNSDKKAGSEKE